MNQDYVKAAIRTECSYDRYSGEIRRGHTAANLLELIDDIVAGGEVADKWKKMLMYGKEPAEGREVLVPAEMPETEIDALRMQRLDDPRFRRIFHAALGLFTESAEVFAALADYLDTGNLDAVNLAEEVGDSFWYSALLLDAVGADPELVARQNIAKLLARYPDKFTEENAIIRDLKREREILEANDTLGEDQ